MWKQIRIKLPSTQHTLHHTHMCKLTNYMLHMHTHMYIKFYYRSIKSHTSRLPLAFIIKNTPVRYNQVCTYLRSYVIPGLVGDHVPPVSRTTELADFNKASLYCELYHYILCMDHCVYATLIASFQMANVHPPTLRMISLKNGDRSRQVIAPE